MNGNFTVSTKKLKSAVIQYKDISKLLSDCVKRLEAVRKNLDGSSYGDVISTIVTVEETQKNRIKNLQAMERALYDIIQTYEQTDKKICNSLGINKDNNRTNENTSNINVEASDDDYFAAMTEYYGFSEEEAGKIKEAYEIFGDSDISKGLNNKEKINLFFSNMASLFSNYSGDSMLFKQMGDNPTQSNAVNFFNNLGLDGEKLKEIVNNQYNNCEGKRDFAHECAIYSVMANENLQKSLAGLVDNVDELVGFKGDIYSKSMGIDDIKSDIAAVNIYNRMLESSDGNIFAAFTDYNEGCADGTINESREFLESYGNGDAEKGMEKLIDRIDDTSFGTWYLSGEYGGYGAYGVAPYSYSSYGYTGYSGYGYQEYGYLSGNDGVTVKDCKDNFLKYLSEESGVNY